MNTNMWIIKTMLMATGQYSRKKSCKLDVSQYVSVLGKKKEIKKYQTYLQ